MYYEQEDETGAFDRAHMQNQKGPKDYMTAGEPFNTKNNYIPGGVLS